MDKKYFKDNLIIEAMKDYMKRCSRFVEVNLFYKLNEKLLLHSSSFNINVNKYGDYLNSIEFSKIINNCLINRFKNINVLFENNDFKSNYDICFLNADIISTGFLYVMVIEQIYRSYKIINNHPYHK